MSAKGSSQGDISHRALLGKHRALSGRRKAFSGQHTSFSVKQRVFFSQTGLSKVRKGPSRLIQGPSDCCEAPREQGSALSGGVFLGQIEGLDRLIEGPCRPTECLPGSIKGSLSLRQGLTRSANDPLVESPGIFKPNSGLQRALFRPVQGPLRPRGSPSEQHRAF